jgi:hypothetical protein
MRKVCVSAQVVAMAIAGCSTAPNDCTRLAAEQRRMYTRADDLASLGGATAREAEYARLRAEYEALREAAILKKCETRSTPSLQEARSDASAAQGGTGPRIAPPEAPSE